MPILRATLIMFLPNVPGAMFIQGGTFIPESRVPLTLCSRFFFIESDSDGTADRGIRARPQKVARFFYSYVPLLQNEFFFEGIQN